MSPREIVRETLLAVLPPGVPPSFRAIEMATATGRGQASEINARVTMFDGLPAMVRLRRWTLGWSHCFTELPGGDVSFEGGEWVRVANTPDASGSEPFATSPQTADAEPGMHKTILEQQ